MDADGERGDRGGFLAVVGECFGFVVVGVAVRGVGGESAVVVLDGFGAIAEFGVFLRDTVVGESVVGLDGEDLQKFGEAISHMRKKQGGERRKFGGCSG